jgi:hypothetical protein
VDDETVVSSVPDRRTESTYDDAWNVSLTDADDGGFEVQALCFDLGDPHVP